MKNFIIMLLVSLCFVACSTERTAQERRANALQLQSQIKDSLYNRTFKVDINYVSPLRMRPHHLTDDYSVSIHGDSLKSWLPYFGVAHYSSYADTEKSPLTFEAPTQNFFIRQGKRGSYIVTFRTVNNMEYFDYVITVFQNGKASVSISTTNRDPISFEGQMDVTIK